MRPPRIPLDTRNAMRRMRRRTRETYAPTLTDTDQHMMQRAIALARKAANVGEVPIGAVVYRGSDIVAEAANNRETTHDPTGHAELIALSLAGRELGTWRLDDCSLAVTLEPCPMCAGAMVNARLGRLIYGAVDSKAGAVTTLYRIPTDSRLNHRVTVIGGVQAASCRRLLQAFFADKRGWGHSKEKSNDR